MGGATAEQEGVYLGAGEAATASSTVCLGRGTDGQTVDGRGGGWAAAVPRIVCWFAETQSPLGEAHGNRQVSQSPTVPAREPGSPWQGQGREGVMARRLLWGDGLVGPLWLSWVGAGRLWPSMICDGSARRPPGSTGQ